MAQPAPPTPHDHPRGLTPDGRLKTGRLAGLSMGAAVWVIAWPVMIDQFLSSLVSLTDTVLAAAISEPAADAIGSAAYLLWFIGLFFISLDVGVTALISRSIGGGKRAVADAAVGQAMLIAVAFGVTLGLIVYLATPFLAPLMSLKGEAAEDFTSYMTIVAVDTPVMALMYAGIACLRGAGDSLRPMRALLVVNLVNITASFALSGVDMATARVVGGETVRHVWLHNPFSLDLGVAGIALGTLMAHAAGATLILSTLLRGTSTVRIRAHRLRPHWHTLRRILRVGFPNFLEMVGMWFGNFLVILMVGWIGAGVVGAHMVAVRIEALSFQPGFAMAIAAATLAGQYLGAGSPRHARRAILICAGVASAIMGAIGLAFIFLPRTLVGLVSSQPAHLEMTPTALLITGLVQIPFAVGIVFRQAMRGAGDVKAVMWITWINTYALRLPLVYIFGGIDIPLPQSLGGGTLENPFGFEPSLAGVWVGLCVELTLRGAAFTWRFLQGGWAHKRV